jgi:hypothetical protein
MLDVNVRRMVYYGLSPFFICNRMGTKCEDTCKSNIYPTEKGRKVHSKVKTTGIM